MSRREHGDDESDTDSDTEVKRVIVVKNGSHSSSDASGSSSSSDSDSEAKQPAARSAEDSDDREEQGQERKDDGGMGLAISDSEDDEDNWEPKKDEQKDSDSDSESQRTATDEEITEAHSFRPQSTAHADSAMAESENGMETSVEEAVDAIVGERATEHEVQEAKWLMRKFISYVPVAEGTSIRRGLVPDGPPIENPIAHADEFARKFRWPQHVRNLRNRDFYQDPSEVLEDYEVLPPPQQPSEEEDEQSDAEESAFAPVPRPILALAAKAVRNESRKRKRAAIDKSQDEPKTQEPSANTLLNIARIGGQFGEQFVESLLSANGKALQGLDGSLEDYDHRCWTSLPMSRKPVANWRFVLEHLRKRVENPNTSGGEAYPPIQQRTLARIIRRLKQHYGLAWQYEDNVFKVPELSSDGNTADTSITCQGAESTSHVQL
ncbi:hypothetical protein PHYBOEH_010956 [Phytophthora boehmeriae]|uniref:Uncharacterized protein n=1 Tax=Phytophthora boehmeriae TaxID=109152 RepID=A0A8T1X3K1_9STRA|nr:hypothetical protein PHYBOEH_010956 [Phytophthora boehmeriae]